MATVTPQVFYRIQSNESHTIFDPYYRSFHSRVVENPFVLFDPDYPYSFPRLTGYLNIHLNNYKHRTINTPFISLDSSPYSTLQRAKSAERRGRTGTFVVEIVPSAAKGTMHILDARKIATAVDGLTIPQCITVKPQNWQFTENEWLAVNQVPGIAVRRIWASVQAFEYNLSHGLTYYYNHNHNAVEAALPFI